MLKARKDWAILARNRQDGDVLNAMSFRDFLDKEKPRGSSTAVFYMRNLLKILQKQSVIAKYEVIWDLSCQLGSWNEDRGRTHPVIRVWLENVQRNYVKWLRCSGKVKVYWNKMRATECREPLVTCRCTWTWLHTWWSLEVLWWVQNWLWFWDSV